MSSNSNIIKLLQLLEQETDESNILTIPQIQKRLMAKGIHDGLDRRTLGEQMKTLTDCGYDISSYAENHKGYYFLRTHCFEDCEIRFLIDSVATSMSIPNAQRADLITKLTKLHSKKFKGALAGVQFLSENFVQNPELFLNIELVEEAINKHRQLELSSCNWGSDKNLHPNYGGKRFTVNPYKMVVQNQKYYLICNYEGHEALSHIRLDRMMGVSITEKIAATCMLDWRGYVTEHPFMYSGKSEHATLCISCDIIGDVLDTFGADVTFTNKQAETVNITLKANSQALAYWAVQYGTKCEVLTPPALRKTVAEMAQTIVKKYTQQD
ncbi:MAG: WYL domain-containing protein [Anaerovoracaceae bacterium]